MNRLHLIGLSVVACIFGAFFVASLEGGPSRGKYRVSEDGSVSLLYLSDNIALWRFRYSYSLGYSEHYKSLYRRWPNDRYTQPLVRHVVGLIEGPSRRLYVGLSRKSDNSLSAFVVVDDHLLYEGTINSLVKEHADILESLPVRQASIAGMPIAHPFFDRLLFAGDKSFLNTQDISGSPPSPEPPPPSPTTPDPKPHK